MKIADMTQAARLDELTGLADELQANVARFAALSRADWPGASVRFLRAQDGSGSVDALVDAAGELEREAALAHRACHALAELALRENERARREAAGAA